MNSEWNWQRAIERQARFAHITDSYERKRLENMAIALERLEEEECEIEIKLNTNRMAQKAIVEGLKYAEKTHKHEKRQEEQWAQAKESFGNLTRTVLSGEMARMLEAREIGERVLDGKATLTEAEDEQHP